MANTDTGWDCARSQEIRKPLTTVAERQLLKERKEKCQCHSKSTGGLIHSDWTVAAFSVRYCSSFAARFTKHPAPIRWRRKHAHRVQKMWAIYTLVAPGCDCPGGNIKNMDCCHKHSRHTNGKEKEKKRKFSDSEWVMMPWSRNNHCCRDLAVRCHRF